ncbi:MAG: hypothetical protein HZA92_02165 [Verrucomicrobia bacterium]|nr:hypothetical protein [Verrucomicrobiota bacterium]
MELALKILEWTVGLAVFGWFFWWRLQKDESGSRGFVIKFSASLVVGYLFIRFGVAWFREGGLIAIVGLGAGMSCALAMAIIWRDELTGVIGNLFGSVYEDRTPIEPKPYYAHAEARRMAGDFPAAIAAVREQLEKFPDDFDGRMRLAALLAEHSEDLPGALVVIEDTLRLKTLAPGQISYALNTAADWHLKFGRDVEAASLAIERISTLLPGTEAALHAQQRLANFATPEMLAREDNRQPIAMPEYERKIGMHRKFVAAEKPDINAEERRLRERLAKRANDWTAREELARLYVEQFEFFERGLQELEILITTPGQPKQEVVRWLHQKADWQVKLFNDVEGGRATLKRIQELFPNSAAAHRAATAMFHLQPVSKFARKKAEE